MPGHGEGPARRGWSRDRNRSLNGAPQEYGLAHAAGTGCRFRRGTFTQLHDFGNPAVLDDQPQGGGRTKFREQPFIITPDGWDKEGITFSTIDEEVKKEADGTTTWIKAGIFVAAIGFLGAIVYFFAFVGMHK